MVHFGQDACGWRLHSAPGCGQLAAAALERLDAL